MSTILRLPDDCSSGVLVLTTQERDHILTRDPGLRGQLEAMKSRWLIGLHHNWHDHTFRYDPLFDFSMAGEDDLREVNGTEVPLVTMDACNFVPAVFRPPDGERFWDILYIARAVAFKRLPEFLNAVRKLYDQGHRYRVLCISPMPPYDPADAGTVVYDLRERYEALFDDEEQGRFILLTPGWRYPFPFDLDTIAFFYRSSKAFAHFADDERRCRVAGYAWACGMPVVAMAAVGSLLPRELRKPPYLFEVWTDSDYPRALRDAVEAAERQPDGAQEAATHFREAETVPQLDARLAVLAARRDLPYSTGRLFGEGLGIRLGRHHGFPASPNHIEMPVPVLLDTLADPKTPEWLGEHPRDPERALDTRHRMPTEVRSAQPVTTGSEERGLSRLMRRVLP